MIITLVAIFLMVYLFFTLFTVKSSSQVLTKMIVLLLIFSNYIKLGYFIKIGSFEFDYQEFLLIIVILWGLIFNLKKLKIDKKFALISIFFTVSIMIGILYLVLDPPNYLVTPINGSWDYVFWGLESKVIPRFDLEVIKRVVRLFLFLVLAVILKNHFKNHKHWLEVEEKFINFGLFNLLYCYIELIVKNVLGSQSLVALITFLFGKGKSQINTLIVRNNFNLLQGFTREPSHLAYTLLFFLCVVIFTNNLSIKKKVSYFVLSSLILFSSGSLAGFSVIGVCGFFLYCYVKNPATKVIFSLMLIVGAFTVYSFFEIDYYLSRLGALIQMGNFVGSEGIRMMSIMDNFNIFLSRPLFGLGIGTTFAHGFIPSLLSNIGVIGTCLWAILVLQTVRIKAYDKKVIAVLLTLAFVWIFTFTIDLAYSVNVLLLLYSIKYGNMNDHPVKV